MAQKSCKVKELFWSVRRFCAVQSPIASATMVPAGVQVPPDKTMGREMAERSWFYAAGGQQQGPVSEAQLRDLINRGAVTADTLVWSEGMAAWQKAGEIPGLSSGGAAPPVIPRSGRMISSAGGYGGGGTLSVDFGIWDFVWRTIVMVVGAVLVIPAPWVIVWYVNWLVSCVHVPGRPNLSFTGRPLTIAPWFYGAIILDILAYWLSDDQSQAMSNLVSLVWVVLYWLFIRWFVANLASDGQPLGLSFSGSFWAYFGWNLLTALSILTIIGWAWVYTAMMRWICRNIQGTQHQIVFKGTGLEYLWRAIVTAIASSFIIPMPWVVRWLLRWQASQTELVEPGSQPGV
jgi:GYF domain 2